MKKVCLFFLICCITAFPIGCDKKDDSGFLSDTQPLPEIDEATLENYDVDKSLEKILNGKGEVYKHVLLIGVDGAGTFFEQTDTPCIDSVFKDKFSTNKCVTSNPTISAQCWGSLFTGVSPELHQRTNVNVLLQKYINKQYPTFFKMLTVQKENAKTASYCEWKGINNGIIETGIGVDKQSGNSEEIKDKVVQRIKTDMPDLFYVHFDSVDHLGHTYGFGGEKYLEQITVIDGYIGEIYKTLSDCGYSDDTLFIVVADHGGIQNNHGGQTEQEKYVFFGASGKFVKNCKNVLMSIRSVSAIAIYSLGYKGNALWKFYDENTLKFIGRDNMLFSEE